MRAPALLPVAALLTGFTVASPALAQQAPSAGGFYTFVSAGIGPRAGFITGWLYAVNADRYPNGSSG